tara:strand:- start:353 stop:730 length:378 start_codon:yes stop_codon:yes gene_type:complete
METTKTIETTKTYELEFIITYNKEIYKSDNPNKKGLELVKSGKYKQQNIVSFKLPKDELLDVLELPIIIEYLYGKDENFNDIWKVSMCVYRNGNEDFDLPKWYDECDGKIFEIQKLRNKFQINNN